MKARKSKSEQPEIGTHLARVVRLAALGHQPAWEYNGEEVPSSHQLEITYELVNTLMKDGKPFFVSEQLKNSDNEASSLSVRVAATGASFDKLEEMLEKPVMVTVKLSQKGRAQVAGKGGVSGVPVGMPIPDLVNEPKSFDPYSENVDMEEFDSFPEWKQDSFKKALDFGEMVLSRKLAEENNL